MQDVAAILEVISIISSSLSLDKILQQFAEKTVQIAGADSGAISSWDLYDDTVLVLADYVSPDVLRSPHDIRTVGQAYPLIEYPASLRVLHHHSSLLICVDDPQADPTERALLQKSERCGVLIVPMLHKEQAVGLLELYSNDQHWPDRIQAHIPLCQALANQAAVAIENAQLYEKAKDERLHAEAMQVISRALTSELDYQRIVHNVADFAYRLVDSQFICVAVPEADKLYPVAIAGVQGTPTKQPNGVTNFSTYKPLTLPDKDTFTRILQGPLVISDIQQDETIVTWRQEGQTYGWRGMVIVPLFAREEFLGVLIACANTPNAFSHNDVEVLMSLASQAAVAIQNAKLFAELEAKRKALHKMSLRLVDAQDGERRRIARELHDELGQALTALKINLELSHRALPIDAPAQLSKSLREASTLTRETLDAARSLSLELHPPILDDLGLGAALRWAVARYEKRLGWHITLNDDIIDISLSSELEITIYRIITEALTNAARHAQAKSVSIVLAKTSKKIIMTVTDDGVGFATQELLETSPKHESLGLVGMKERAELMDGHFEIESKPGQGTRIQATLPILFEKPR